MKKILVLIPFLMFASKVYCQRECKPDIDKVDKIDNTVNKVWEIRLGSLGFGQSLMSKQKDWTVYLKFIRNKNQNFISFTVSQILNEDEMRTASKFWAGKNMELTLAFENSSPVTFQSQIPIVSQSKLLGTISYQVHLMQILNEDKMNELYNALQKNRVSAFRVNLIGDKIEKSLNKGKSENILEKFTCFYNYNKENPVPQVKDLEINKEFILDPNTNKYSFSEIVTIDKPQSNLFAKAKSWLVKFNAEKKVNYENAEEGKLIAYGIYKKTYNTNNLVSEDTYTYNATISVKDGKYKYEITDIQVDDAKQKLTLEALIEQLKSRSDLLENGMIEIKSNLDKIINSLKSDMAGKSDEW